jgi:hypothetical protein
MLSDLNYGMCVCVWSLNTLITVGVANGIVGCTPCPDGKAARFGQSTCNQCPIGWYAAKSSQFDYIKCEYNVENANLPSCQSETG